VSQGRGVPLLEALTVKLDVTDVVEEAVPEVAPVAVPGALAVSVGLADAHADGPWSRGRHGTRHLPIDHRLAPLHEMGLGQHRVRHGVERVHRHGRRLHRGHHFHRHVQRGRQHARLAR
jgi:hypothetical protein